MALARIMLLALACLCAHPLQAAPLTDRDRSDILRNAAMLDETRMAA